MDSETFDVCIIGAGMFGSAAARHASANPALNVCLIGPEEPKDEDKQTREIHGSHYDEGRIVRIAFDCHGLQVLSKATIYRFREIEKLSGIQFYQQVGAIVMTEKNSKYFHKLIEALDLHGVKYVNMAHDDSLTVRYPYLKLDARDYPIFDDDGSGYISPRKLVEAQKRIARSQGCHVIDAVVNEVKELDSGKHEILTESGKVIRAKRVIICTGGFTPFKQFPMLKGLKITVNKETAALLRISVKERDRLSYMPTIALFRDGLADMPPCAHGAYILPPIQYPNGKFYLKIGHMGCQRNSEVKSLEEIRKWYNSEGDPEVIEKYSKFLHTIIPDLETEAVESKTCITCDSPTGLPYIDRITPTVTVAVIGNGRGATICDEVGRLAAELSLTGEWDSELSQSSFKAQWENLCS